MNSRELIQQLDHSVVVLQRMQPHPRQTVFARHQVLVKGLVLVPEKNYAQHGHGIRLSSPIGTLLGILQSSMERRPSPPYSDGPRTGFRSDRKPLQVGTLWTDSLDRPAPENL